MQTAGVDFDLYPTEITQVKEIFTHISKKYSNRPDTRENLLSLAQETEDLMRKIGLKCVVDVSNEEVDGYGRPISSPIIYIEGRLEQEQFGHDHERHAFEVRSGLLDGKVGTINEQGEVKESPSKIIIPGK